MPLLFLVWSLLSFLLGACSGLGGHSFERRNIQTVFVGHGITRYFLPRLPWWANRSPAGRCVRGTSMQMFHMPLVRGSFNLTYREAHQLQLMFNVELERAGEVSLQGEEEFFFRVSDKVMAGVRLFHPPTHHRVHLIWADPFFEGKNGAVRLQRLLKSPPMQKGHPVLVSLCRSYRELGEDLRRLGLSEADIRLMPYEFFNPYSRERKLLSFDALDFSAFFESTQALHFFLPRGETLPREFQGDFRVHLVD